MDPLRICYKTFEIGKLDIHVRMLRDTRQYEDKNGVAEKFGICSAAWPIFGVIWPASEVLARLMLEYHVKGKRVLEVGCGIALASLVLNQRLANITATDYHPEAGNFLAYNTALNENSGIPFFRTGWDEMENNLGVFDIIIGSDLLYERGHAASLSSFINRHAKGHCDVVIVDPGRGNHRSFTNKMAHLKFLCRQEKPSDSNKQKKTDKCVILHFSR